MLGKPPRKLPAGGRRINAETPIDDLRPAGHIPAMLRTAAGHLSLHARSGFVRRRAPLLLPGLAALLALTVVSQASPLRAQRAEVAQEENFRNEPNGGLLAVLAPGTGLVFHERRERWVEATMEGWVWARSLLTTDRVGYDLIVSTGDGENLRDRPSGEVLGRLEDGTFLEEVERIPGWIRVRRRGWIWGPSVVVDEAAPAPLAEVQPVPVTEEAAPGSSAAESNRPVEDGGDEAAEEGQGPAETNAPPLRLSSGTRRALLDVPDGDTLSILGPEAELAVVDREGDWARVRVEGWLWLPEGDEDAGGARPSERLDYDTVVRNPTAARGRVVTWELQFIRLERAEAFRTDFEEGEPFLLTRPVGDAEGGFVYVAVPAEALADAEGLVPLETLTVVARVRTGASELMGRPVLDLVELRRR